MNFHRIMNRDGTFVTDEMDMRRVRMEHFKSLQNIGNNEKVIVHVCGLDGARRNRYFGHEIISMEKLISEVKNLKNDKS